jgi:hypothetical protein
MATRSINPKSRNSVSRNVGEDAQTDRPASYLLAASTAATTAAQIRATSSSLARYGGIV